MVKPWLAQRNKMGKDRPSFVQVRRKVQNNVTIDDFVVKISIIYLQYLQKQVVSPTPQTISLLSVMGAMNDKKLLATPTNLLPNMTTAILSRKDQDVLAVIDELKVKGQWPKQRDRLKQFVDNEKLNELRRHHSEGVQHRPVLLNLRNK